MVDFIKDECEAKSIEPTFEKKIGCKSLVSVYGVIGLKYTMKIPQLPNFMKSTIRHEGKMSKQFWKHVLQ